MKNLVYTFKSMQTSQVIIQESDSVIDVARALYLIAGCLYFGDHQYMYLQVVN